MKAGQHCLRGAGSCSTCRIRSYSSSPACRVLKKCDWSGILHPDGLTVVHATTAQDRFVQQGALRVSNVLHVLPAEPGIFQAFADQFHLPLAVAIQAPYRDARWFPDAVPPPSSETLSRSSASILISVSFFVACAAPQTVQVSGRPLFPAHKSCSTRTPASI